jgi:hypothetical protein
MILLENKTGHMNISGTIIDFETVGEFDKRYQFSDSRRYASHKPTIFGYLTGDRMVQYCAEGVSDIDNVITQMNEILPVLEPPFYALNCHFERGVCTHSCTFTPSRLLDVRGENSTESKWAVRRRLGIPTYDDPFNGKGYQCLLEWQKENYPDCLKHNQACLQIERDILQHTQGLCE